MDPRGPQSYLLELKRYFGRRQRWRHRAAIVPFGIETTKSGILKNNSILAAIVPFGIETGKFYLAKGFQGLAAIVPFGIETYAEIFDGRAFAVPQSYLLELKPVDPAGAGWDLRAAIVPFGIETWNSLRCIFRSKLDHPFRFKLGPTPSYFRFGAFLIGFLYFCAMIRLRSLPRFTFLFFAFFS